MVKTYVVINGRISFDGRVYELHQKFSSKENQFIKDMINAGNIQVVGKKMQKTDDVAETISNDVAETSGVISDEESSVIEEGENPESEVVENL